jgi:hypothetical protein
MLCSIIFNIAMKCQTKLTFLWLNFVNLYENKCIFVLIFAPYHQLMVEYWDGNTSVRITILNVFYFVITERDVYQARWKELKVCIKDNFIWTHF